MARPKGSKLPTSTSLVLAALKQPGVDFMNYKMLVDATGRSYPQVTAALFSLRGYRAVDLVVEVDGKGWWYALPPEQDTRLSVRDERTPEVKPRKARKPKVKLTTQKG